MGRKSKRVVLDVYMNRDRVGQLTQLADGAITFSYDKIWAQRSPATSISRSIPVTTITHRGAVVANYFDNLLPDNDAIRKTIAQKNHARSERPFDLLAAIGRDCVGALQLLPVGSPAPEARLSSSPIDEDGISRVLKNLEQAPLGINEEEDFRISIAGAQEKTAFLKRSDGWHISHGTTPTTHIFKVPMGVFQNGIDMRESVENEWLCLKICKAFGLNTAKAEMAAFKDSKALIVERFDRQAVDGEITRIPQEDFCQILGYPANLKYENDGGPGIKQIVEVLAESNKPNLDRRTFMMAQVLFWAIGATDGHAKNFSVFLIDGGIEMTPIYDVLSALPVVEAGRFQYEKLKLAMAVGNSRRWSLKEIAGRHWLQTAKLSRFPEDTMKEILAEIIDRHDQAIEAVRAELPDGFPQHISEPILNGLKKHVKRLKMTDPEH